MLTFSLTHTSVLISLCIITCSLIYMDLHTHRHIPMNTFILGKDTPIYFPTETLLYDGVKDGLSYVFTTSWNPLAKKPASTKLNFHTFSCFKYWLAQTVCLDFSLTSYGKAKRAFWPTQNIPDKQILIHLEGFLTAQW